MGLVNLPTGMVHFYGRLVGKYTGFWDNLFAYVSEAILCEELIPDDSTLEELIEWAKENKLPMRFRVENALVIYFLLPTRSTPQGWQQTVKMRFRAPVDLLQPRKSLDRDLFAFNGPRHLVRIVPPPTEMVKIKETVRLTRQVTGRL